MKPVLQALILAERVYQAIDGKKVIAGTFNQVYFSQKVPIKEETLPDGTKQRLLPGGLRGGSPYVYISLTDVCDKTKLLLQFVNVTRNVVLFSKQIDIPSKDRLQTIELILPLPALPISEEGTYAFEVVCESEILGFHRITAKELKFDKE